MKTIAYLFLFSALFLFATNGLLADEDEPDDDGGSAFDEPEEGGEEEKEPFPATFATQDYKVEMSVEDGRFWKQDKNYSENEQKANVILKLNFKLPKSESHFDVIVQGRGWEHNLQFDFDGTKVKSDNYKKMCGEFFASAMKTWKDIRDPVKPKKLKLGRKFKAYYYAITGTPEGTSFPRKQECYFFKLGSKTYLFTLIYNTTAAKSERVIEEIEALLKTVQERKTRRR